MTSEFSTENMSLLEEIELCDKISTAILADENDPDYNKEEAEKFLAKFSPSDLKWFQKKLDFCFSVISEATRNEVNEDFI